MSVGSPAGGESSHAWLLGIGRFAGLTGTTVKALRHYHELGVLAPAHVDPSTGYRRYAPAQIPDARLIAELRALDVPLPTIRAVLGTPDGAGRRAILEAHRREAQAEIARRSQALRRLDDLLGGDEIDAAAPEIRTRAGQLAVAVRWSAPWDDLATVLADGFARVAGALAAAGMTAVGPPVARYPSPDLDEEQVVVETALPIADARRPPPETRLVLLQGGPVAAALHVGDYSDLPTTYGRVARFVHARALTPADVLEEHYLSPPQTPPPARRTEVVWPLRESC